jgi:hypothetical protein
MRDLPSSGDLLDLARELLLSELMPRIPPEHHRDARLIATAMAIAGREADAGLKWQNEIEALLAGFYADDRNVFPVPANGDGKPPSLLARLADDQRRGAFETCPSRQHAARMILWRLVAAKLREGNPQFLAANGFK